jgi:hypothetical protein
MAVGTGTTTITAVIIDRPNSLETGPRKRACFFEVGFARNRWRAPE